MTEMHVALTMDEPIDMGEPVDSSMPRCPKCGHAVASIDYPTGESGARRAIDAWWWLPDGGHQVVALDCDHTKIYCPFCCQGVNAPEWGIDLRCLGALTFTPYGGLQTYLLRDAFIGALRERAARHGWPENGKPLAEIDIPWCGGHLVIQTEADVPHESVPCPCGDPNHWLVKYLGPHGRSEK